MRRIALVVALALGLALVLPAAGWAEEPVGNIRVRLASAGTPAAVDFRVKGAYRVAEDATLALLPNVTYRLALAAEGEGLTLTWSDGVADRETTLPASVTLRRYGNGGGDGCVVLNHPSYGWKPYEGDVTITRGLGGLTLINTLPLERYLMGVLACEMGDSWPAEALKAQAVCARTYALRYLRAAGNEAWDVGDTTAWQAYRGSPRDSDGDLQPHIAAAVEATAGQALYYDGALLDGVFSASNGGYIRTASEVWGGANTYHVAKADPWDSANPLSPSYTFLFPKGGETGLDGLTVVDRARAERTLRLVRQAVADARGEQAEGVAIKAITGVTPTALRSGRSPGSQEYTQVAVAVRAVVSGAPFDSTVTITYTAADGKTAGDLRLAFAEYDALLPTSNLWQMTAGEEGACWTITVRGFGHGVGMSQRGAQMMAKDGKGYETILEFYYNYGSGGSKPVQLRAVTEETPTLPPLSAEGALAAGRVTADGLNLRAAPDLQGTVAAVLARDTALSILERRPGWYKVFCPSNGLTGYVSADHVTLESAAIPTGTASASTSASPSPSVSGAAASTPPGVMVTPSKVRPPAIDGLWGLLDSPCPLHLRAEPETGAPTLGLVPRNASLELLSVDGKAHWLRVRWQGTEGYVLARYVRTASGRPCTLTDGPTPLRAAALSSGHLLRTLPAGQMLEAGAVVRTGLTLWRRVSVDGQQGYVPERVCRLAWK